MVLARRHRGIVFQFIKTHTAAPSVRIRRQCEAHCNKPGASVKHFSPITFCKVLDYQDFYFALAMGDGFVLEEGASKVSYSAEED
jgi:hypothetical protein